MNTAVTETAARAVKIAASAKPAPCSTGSWAQKFSCGYHQPTTGAAHAGTFVGTNVMPGLIVLFVFFLIIAAIRSAAKRRGLATQNG